MAVWSRTRQTNVVFLMLSDENNGVIVTIEYVEHGIPKPTSAFSQNNMAKKKSAYST
jgi:hypothetical protein